MSDKTHLTKDPHKDKREIEAEKKFLPQDQSPKSEDHNWQGQAYKHREDFRENEGQSRARRASRYEGGDR